MADGGRTGGKPNIDAAAIVGAIVVAIYLAIAFWCTGYGAWWTGVDIRDQIVLARDPSCAEDSDKPGVAAGACSWQSATAIDGRIVEIDARYDHHDEYEMMVAPGDGSPRTFRIDDFDTYEAAKIRGAKVRLQTFEDRAIRLTCGAESANANESPMWRLSKDPVPLIGAGVMWLFFFAMRAGIREAKDREARAAAKAAAGSS